MALAQSPPSAPPDSVFRFGGVFRAGAGHDIVIAPFRVGSGWTLLLSDLQSDAMRFLAPAGARTFTTGTEMVRPTPIEWTLRFGGPSAADELVIDPGGLAPEFPAKRVPIDAVPISFVSGATRLEGYLYRPRSGRGRLPLVALAHGSEASDRYSFGPTPLALAAQGFAVLAYDKRGTGASGGDWEASGLEDYADDLVAGIRAMTRRPDVDSARVGVLGFSEGGWVAPLAASRSAAIKSIAVVNGGARTKGDAYVFKVRRETEAAGRPASVDRRVAYDPTDHWRRFRGPVLYMGGEADVLESGPDAAAWYRRLFAESGNVDVTIRLWPRTHHGLLLGVTGEPSEFRTFRGIAQLAPGYWDVLLRWLTAQLRP
jgi:dienelactone hydrolase